MRRIEGIYMPQDMASCFMEFRYVFIALRIILFNNEKLGVWDVPINASGALGIVGKVLICPKIGQLVSLNSDHSLLLYILFFLGLCTHLNRYSFQIELITRYM